MLSANTKNKFSNKKIKINNSNIFFKDNLNEITSIIKISNAALFFDEKKLLNLIDLKGKVFNIPFRLNYQHALNSKKKKKINIATILPYKENYSLEKASAASLWVSEFFKKSIQSSMFLIK